MTLDTLLRDARRDCATLTRGQRFDAWLRVWRPAAMALMRKDGPFQGSHLNAWLKIADRLLDACGIEPEAPQAQPQAGRGCPDARKTLNRIEKKLLRKATVK